MRSSSRQLEDPECGRMRVGSGAIDLISVTVDGALDDVNLQVEPGELVAIMGDGGAGKSTLLGVLSRMVEPNAGSIVIDGQLLAKTTLRSSSRLIGVMGPELPLMRGTVRRNLTYAAPNAEPAEVGRVLRAAGLDQLMAELPEGLMTWVAEGGLNLSRSQRQRIALGRALMGNPPLLLLDEPTNGMDGPAKKAFLRLLTQHRGTIMLATHEVDELALADKVVVMHHGRVQEVLSGDEYREKLWLASQKGGRS